MTVTRKWNRLLAVGCSHGGYADPIALRAVLKFRDAWKPDTVVHLGDAVDFPALRSGARGNSDEAEPIRPDLEAGLEFLEELRPSMLFMGNHEARLWHLAQHYQAITAELAQGVIREIERTCRKLKCEMIPYHVMHGNRVIANVRLLHGFFFNEMAIRDAAETFAPEGGSCVFAHTHSPGQARGRRVDLPNAFCVGTLTRIPNLDYAMTRRKSLSWGQGLVYGVYTNSGKPASQLWLHDNGQNHDQNEWRLPIV